jgi:hypothetical protein
VVRVLYLVLGLWLLSAACGTPPPRTVCLDRDGDGYGAGCARGLDCDEDNPLLGPDCRDAGLAPGTCDALPTSEGCPCLRADSVSCFPGPAEREGVGRCHSGRASCVEDRWSACEDAVLPDVELCDGADDDCDGFVDEGVESPCGGCNSECLGGVWGSPAAPFEAEVPLALTAAGELSLLWQPSAAKYLWVANTDEGTVSKIDVERAEEVARYRTRGGYPIQVALDHRGDAFVLDSAFGGRSHLTKIAAEPARCRGTRTSTAAAQVLPVGEDQCVLLDKALSDADDARSLSVDGAPDGNAERAGDVWIGCAGSQQLLHSSGADAHELGRYDLSRYELQPSGSAFDVFGNLWLIARDGKVVRFDPLDPEAAEEMLVPFACYALEALSVDRDGKLLLSGFGCERVFGYDPQRAQWRSAQMPGLLSPRGVSADVAASWISYSSGQLARLDAATLQPTAAMPLATASAAPFETFALSQDGQGKLWAISTQGGPDGVGLATRFDPAADSVTAQLPLGRGPRAGSDLGGTAGGEVAPQGRASHVFAGCGREGRELDAVSQAMTEWLNLRVQARVGVGAKVHVSVRHAPNVERLPDASFVLLGELPRDELPFPLQLPAGGAIEVALDLESPYAIGAPRIARVGVEWGCPGPD